jgi:hypothetical protein
MDTTEQEARWFVLRTQQRIRLFLRGGFGVMVRQVPPRLEFAEEHLLRPRMTLLSLLRVSQTIRESPVQNQAVRQSQFRNRV